MWKNFDLGKEVQVSGTFIYNGLRCFHEMRTLDHAEEVFDFLYNLSVGFERLLKVAVTLLEHDGAQDQVDFENSLKTHNHLDLLMRVKKHAPVSLSGPHYEFLQLLGTFYRTFRYDRFVLSMTWDPEKEKAALRSFLENRLEVVFEPSSSVFPTINNVRFKKYIGRLVAKISIELYRTITQSTSNLNLYTHEIRSDSKAAKIFLKGECDFRSEDVLWKELLVFFMNTKARSGLLDFLRSIEPLEFDEASAADFLQCFQLWEERSLMVDELEELYANLTDPGGRLSQMELIGNPQVYFEPVDNDQEEPDNSRS